MCVCVCVSGRVATPSAIDNKKKPTPLPDYNRDIQGGRIGEFCRALGSREGPRQRKARRATTLAELWLEGGER